MSYQYIRAALETRLDAFMPSIPTAWENVPFAQPSTEYQRVYLLPARTSNPTFGDSLAMESGIFQISLYYPDGNGSSEAMERAEGLRNWFYRGLSLTNADITVRINSKPSISPGQYEPGFYVLIVSVPYFVYTQ